MSEYPSDYVGPSYEISYGENVPVAPVIENGELKGVTHVYLDTAEIAKRIRADLKAAVTAGELPGAPVSYTVNIARFSGGSSIDVGIKGLGDAFIYSGEVGEYGVKHHSEACKELLAKVKEIHTSYNYDGSDVQTDYFNVNFYGQVQVQDDEDAAREAGYKAEKAARKALKGRAYKGRKTGPGQWDVIEGGQVKGHVVQHAYPKWTATPAGRPESSHRSMVAAVLAVLEPGA